MAKKEYKNIYTIMEKAKKGELELESAPQRAYKSIKYNTRDEIIDPYLHHLDEKALRRSVDRFIEETASHIDISIIAKRMNKKLISPDTLIKEMLDIYKRFPKVVANDIFNINYQDIKDLHFKDRTDTNKFRFQLIEKANNPIAKIITRHDNTKSMIYTRSMIQYYIMMLAMLQQEDKDAFDDLMDKLGSGESESGEGDPQEGDQKGDKAGEGNESQSLEDHLETLRKKFDEDPASKKILDKIMETAKKTVDLLDNVLPGSQQRELWQDLGSNKEKDTTKALSKTNIAWLESIEKELNKVGINLNGVKQKIKNLLDKSVNYFSSKNKTYFDSIFDAGTLDGLENIELLHPILRKISIEDIMVKDIKKMGKIDIYIDASGSMDSGCGTSGVDNKYMTKILFAKAFAFKMKEMDLLNNAYSFQSDVRFEGSNKNDILAITGGGGTSLRKVVTSIESVGRNAIVLTDAEDNCPEYSSKAFFIGVKGARFNQFNKEYMERGQTIVFDGVRIHSVDSNGNTIT